MMAKPGPKNPTLPVNQNREGRGTHFETFGKKLERLRDQRQSPVKMNGAQ